MVPFSRSDRPAPVGRPSHSRWHVLLGTLLLLLLAAPRPSWAGSCASISSLSPATGRVGASVRIIGAFGQLVNYEVTFNGVPATTATLVSSSEIVATVPAGATTGLVEVRDQDLFCTSNGVTFTVQANNAPTALRLSNDRVAENAGPNAVVGNLITTDPNAGDTFTYSLVAGVGGADNAAFNILGNQLRLTASADAEVRAGYNIRVRTTDAGGLFFERPFTIFVTNVLETPTLTMISPAAAPVGANLVLNGTDLVGNVSVSFNGTVVAATASFGAVQLVVPAGAMSGPLTVTTSAGTSNALPFVVVRDLVVSSSQTIAQGTYNSVTVTGTGIAEVYNNVVVTDFFRVEAGGQLLMYGGPTTGIGGPGTFTLAAGALLSVAYPLDAPGTSTGPIQVSGARALSTDAIYEYRASGSATGLGLPTTVRELRVRRDLTLSQPLAIRQRLMLGEPSNNRSPLGGPSTPPGVYTAGNALTLLSTAALQAYVVQNDPTATVFGDLTVQRYVGGPAALGYRHLSSPVQNSTVADLATAGFTPKVNPAYNALPTPTLPAAQFPTVFGYDETRGGTTPAYQGFATGYYSPAGLATTLTPGRGWDVLMGGGKTPDFVGTLTTGDVPQSLTVTGTNASPNTQKAGWHLLGNPYAQPIDWDLVTPGNGPGQRPAGMSASISVYRTSGGNNGQYLTRANGTGNLPDGLLALGQAFFARATSASTFTFTDALRVEANPGPVARPAANAAATRPTLRLALTGAGATAIPDETVVYVQAGATLAEDLAFDGLRPGRNTGTVPTLATVIDGQEATINALPETVLTGAAPTVVELTAVLPTAGAYTLAVAGLAGFGTTPVEMLDRLTGTRYDLTRQPVLTLTATRANDVVAGRFAVVFNGRRTLGTAHLAPGTAALALFPNPASAGGAVRITGLAAGTRVTVLDVTGRPVATATATTTGDAALTTTQLAAGTYVVRAQDGRTTRLVVE